MDVNLDIEIQETSLLSHFPRSHVVLEYISKLKFTIHFSHFLFPFLIFVFSHKSFDSSAGARSTPQLPGLAPAGCVLKAPLILGLLQ